MEKPLNIYQKVEKKFDSWLLSTRNRKHSIWRVAGWVAVIAILNFYAGCMVGVTLWETFQ